MNISIVGAGNMAYQLTQALSQHPQITLTQLYSRSGFSEEFTPLQVEKITDLTLLRPADICILAVSDDAISSLSAALPFENQLVVHTSGNTDMLAISSKNRRGVYYPLQTMSKQTLVDFTQVPICLEAEHPTDYQLLHQLATQLTTHIYPLSSHQRKILHVAAVFLNNFTNHLVHISQQICQEEQVPFEILKPLLAETFAKLQKLPAYQAQTGPARRNDTSTIASHLSLLHYKEKEIYQVITNSIINTYGRKEL